MINSVTEWNKTPNTGYGIQDYTPNTGYGIQDYSIMDWDNNVRSMIGFPN